MSENVIETRDLRMSYEGTEVLRGVDLEVRAGEVFALLGPNGAGKTTTIEILEGFRRRSGGDVKVLGGDPGRSDPASSARIGLVLQHWRDHPRWRVRELLRHVAKHYTDPRDPDELLATMGLTAQGGQQLRRLSGGQRRRVDVALGLVGRPQLLFLDEPTVGFDPQVRRDFHELIEKLAADDGLTVLLTTHDLHEAERLADRVAILVAGRIVACDESPRLAEMVEAESEVRWREDGELKVTRTIDPSATAWRLHQAFGGDVPGLEIRRPTLEESYLRLVAEHSDKPARAPEPLEGRLA